MILYYYCTTVLLYYCTTVLLLRALRPRPPKPLKMIGEADPPATNADSGFGMFGGGATNQETTLQFRGLGSSCTFLHPLMIPSLKFFYVSNTPPPVAAFYLAGFGKRPGGVPCR